MLCDLEKNAKQAHLDLIEIVRGKDLSNFKREYITWVADAGAELQILSNCLFKKKKKIYI